MAVHCLRCRAVEALCGTVAARLLAARAQPDGAGEAAGAHAPLQAAEVRALLRLACHLLCITRSNMPDSAAGNDGSGGGESLLVALAEASMQSAMRLLHQEPAPRPKPALPHEQDRQPVAESRQEECQHGTSDAPSPSTLAASAAAWPSASLPPGATDPSLLALADCTLAAVGTLEREHVITSLRAGPFSSALDIGGGSASSGDGAAIADHPAGEQRRGGELPADLVVLVCHAAALLASRLQKMEQQQQQQQQQQGAHKGARHGAEAEAHRLVLAAVAAATRLHAGVLPRVQGQTAVLMASDAWLHCALEEARTQMRRVEAAERADHKEQVRRA